MFKNATTLEYENLINNLTALNKTQIYELEECSLSRMLDSVSVTYIHLKYK